MPQHRPVPKSRTTVKKPRPAAVEAAPKPLNGYDGIPDEQLTRHQRIAKKTGGIVTGSNGVSLSGAALSGYGAYEIFNDRPVLGVAAFAVGSMGDLVDGRWARSSGTWTEKGALLDATLDKARVIAMIAGLMYTDAVPQEFGWFKIGSQIAIAGVATAGTARGIRIRAENNGKKNMFWTTVAAGEYALADAVHHVSSTAVAHDVALGLEVGGAAAVATTAVYTALTLRDYGREAFGPKPAAQLAPQSPYAGTVTINRSELPQAGNSHPQA